ncbi:hypothetical protein V5F77_04200 [Xanthobacter sp. DSM 24535]|uniref:hypothetical protein n=1 Tax=Roseixanthobacter psychrophilus TaxID=3119917 RepID=UPI00372A8B0E
MKTQSDLLDDMAASLLDNDIDLGDERAVIVHLKYANFMARDITNLMDAAINRARIERAHSPDLKVA